MNVSAVVSVSLLPCLFNCITPIQSACPPEDAIKVLKKIQKMERRLVKQLTRVQQEIFSSSAGKQCSEGPVGPPGLQGPPGVMGDDGVPGRKGIKGQRGRPCIPGPPAFLPPVKGFPGEPGGKSRKGHKGSRGTCVCKETGRQCSMCPLQGPGKRGDRGDHGRDRERGPPGEKGEKGLSMGTRSLPGRRGFP